MRIGYCRTSTVEQLAGLEAQRRDLGAAGCEKMFSEQISSVASREQLGGGAGLPAGRGRARRHQA